MAKLWSGRFSKETNSLLDEFNASLPFDKNLYVEDIKGSIAHAKMLAKQSILTKDEYEAIKNGLKEIKREIKDGDFEFKISDEDIHMAIESKLIERIGEAGKKLHTARSRNDQVAVDFRMFVQTNTKNIAFLTMKLVKTIINIAKENTKTLLPGMTHLQHAQPINFAFHMLAYASMFKRDVDRLNSSYKRNNYSPLGCAALAGTPYEIDRNFTAQELGFTSPSINCLDSVSDRDFALEILFNISTLMMHISRMAEELVMWSSYEFKFVTLSDEFSTGSSIMPQKKNPDVPELLRGKSGRVYGNLMALLTVMKALPLAYNKDIQEDKEGVFDSVETAIISLKILSKTLKTMTINSDKMLSATEMGHLSATDLADYLVKKKIASFRDAHFITGKAVAKAEELQKDISQMTVEELKEINENIQEDVLLYLDLKNSMNSRDSFGGTSEKSTLKQIEYFKKWLKKYKI